FESQAQLLLETLWAQARVSQPPEGHSHASQREQAIALAAMFTCFLAPTAWVLAHVEHYKSRGD
uniref:Uncharacterized protein n=1 Tax=Cairina moschata TaxID=8855 RepID=A0A8C3BK36_CAIMO